MRLAVEAEQSNSLIFFGEAHTGAPGCRLRFSMWRTLNQPKVRGCFSLSARHMEVSAGLPAPVVVLMKQ